MGRRDEKPAHGDAWTGFSFSRVLAVLVRARTLIALGLLALALRAWPLHVFYQHPDQELLPDAAMAALVDGTWRPTVASYPMGEFDFLRAAYGVTYAVGFVLNRYHDRLDLLADYFEDPYPFFLVARVWSCITGVATVVMTAALAARLGGSTCGIVAGLILALSFGHVRESHWGSLDAPAVAFMVATLLVADRARLGDRRSIVVAGLLTGIATAFRYQLAAVSLALPVAVLAGRHRDRRLLVSLFLAALAAVGAFAALSPYTITEWPRFQRELAIQYRRTFVAFRPTLSLPTLFAAGNGWGVCALAALGAVVALRTWRTYAALLVVAVALALPIGRAVQPFLRHLLPLAPFLAIFAALGATTLASALPDRWRSSCVVALVVLVTADPAIRALELDRLLARADTRELAGQWLVRASRPGTRVFVGGAGITLYGSPILPARVGRPVLPAEHYRAELVARRRALSPINLGCRIGEEHGRSRSPCAFAVTMEHPLGRLFGQGFEDVAARLADRGHEVARFDAFRPDVATVPLFEPFDANAFPLRGFEAIERPGPTITVWGIQSGSRSPTGTP
jgi:hypothetical protein